MSADHRGGRARAEWLLPLLRGEVERASSGLAQPIDVRAHDALAADACPASHREAMAVAGGWPGWSPPLAARRVAIDALSRHLDERRPDGVTPRPEPLQLVRTRLTDARRSPESGLDDWLADATTTDHERRHVAARATGWMSSLVRSAGWPLPDRTTVAPVGRWKHGDVTLVGSLDLLVGKVTTAGEHEGWVVMGSTGRGPRTRRSRAAFEAVAATAGRGIAPARIVVHGADTGVSERYEIDDDLLREGTRLATGAVVQRRLAQERGYDESDATPGAHCRFCELRGRCAPGLTWLQGIGRAQGGLPVLDPD